MSADLPAFVVRFGAGRARRYLARAEGPAVDGLQPFVWVRELARALTFPAAPDARAYALDGLGHSRFDVGRVESA